MKILSITERGEDIVVLTNNANRPEFVYPIGRFPDLKSLNKEIHKSQMKEAERHAKLLSKKSKLMNDYNKEKENDEYMEMIVNA